MSKIKVLTVQFDVTGLSDAEIEALRLAATVQAEDFEVSEDNWSSCDVLNTSVREVEVQDD